MPQIARPKTDVTTAGWSKTPTGGTHSDTLKEVAPVDSSLVVSPADPHQAVFETKLSAVPPPGPGTRTLRVRLRRTSAGSLPTTVTLLQAGTPVASRSPAPTTTFDTYSYDLTPTEAAAITDYADLSVRVTTGAPPFSGDTFACGGCVALPRQYSFLISGVTDAYCPAGPMNATHAVGSGYDANPGCYWVGPYFTGTAQCSGANNDRRWYLERGGSSHPTTWQLRLGNSIGTVGYGSNAVVYERAIADDDCLAALALTRIDASVGPDYATWPATVTVVPV